MKDYYDILGVSPRDKQKKIDQAYRSLCVSYFTEGLDGRINEKEIEEIDEAYQVLVDSRSRKTYDRERRIFHKAYPTTSRAGTNNESQPNANTSGSPGAGSTPKHEPQTQDASSRGHANNQSSQTSQPNDGIGAPLPEVIGLIVGFLFVLVVIACIAGVIDSILRLGTNKGTNPIAGLAYGLVLAGFVTGIVYLRKR